MCTPGYVLDVCAKNEGDRAYGLGGVSDWTHRQTYRGPYAINDIDESFSTGRPPSNVTICFVHRMITVGPIVIKFHPQKAVILRNCKSI